MRLALFGAVSFLTMAAAGSVLAAEAVDAADATPVDPVTVIGSRTEKLASETPSVITVIDDREIEDRLVVDIRDLVKYEPGITVPTQPARFGAALGTAGRDGNSGFNIRGLESNRVLIQVDGVRTPDSFSFGAQLTGRGDYQDLDAIKRVEILRGPASALYGSDGLAGAVAFTTKDPADYISEGETFGGRVRGVYASADEGVQGGATVAGRQGAWSAMVAYTYRESNETENKGTVDTANTDRTKPNPQSFLNRSVLGKLVYQPNDDTRFRLTAEHNDRDISADVLSGITKPPASGILPATAVVRLKAADDIERDRISFDHRQLSDGPIAQLDWSVYWQEARNSQFTSEDRVGVDRTRLNTFDNRVIGLSVTAQSKGSAGGLAHELVYGLDASTTRQSGLRDGTVAPAGETFPLRAFPTTDYRLVGIFVQDEIALADGKLVIVPALRYDSYKLDPKNDTNVPGFTGAGSKGDRFSPKLGGVFSATDEVRLFANYARGFKAPSPSQVNNVFANVLSNYASIPNPDLKPETSEAFEGGLRYVVPGFFAEVTAFSGEYKDFITQTQVSGNFTAANPAIYQFINLAKVKIKGVEARARYTHTSGVSAFAGVAVAEGDSYSPAKAPLDSVQPLKLSGGVGYRPPGGTWGAELAAVHSGRKEADRIAQVCTPSCWRPEAFTVLDLTAYWNLSDSLTVRGGVFNVTDEKYAWWNDARGLSSTAISRDAYTQPGRNVSVSVSYDF